MSKNTLFASVVCDKYKLSFKLKFKVNHFKLISMVFIKYMNLILYCRNNKSLRAYYKIKKGLSLLMY